MGKSAQSAPVQKYFNTGAIIPPSADGESGFIGLAYLVRISFSGLKVRKLGSPEFYSENLGSGFYPEVSYL